MNIVHFIYNVFNIFLWRHRVSEWRTSNAKKIIITIKTRILNQNYTLKQSVILYEDKKYTTFKSQLSVFVTQKIL